MQLLFINTVQLYLLLQFLCHREDVPVLKRTVFPPAIMVADMGYAHEEIYQSVTRKLYNQAMAPSAERGRSFDLLEVKWFSLKSAMYEV